MPGALLLDIAGFRDFLLQNAGKLFVAVCIFVGVTIAMRALRNN